MGRRSGCLSGKMRLQFEALDPRLVLSANAAIQQGAPLEFAASLGPETVVDIVGERTTYRNIDVAGYSGTPDVRALAFLTEQAEILSLPDDIADQLSVIDTKYGIASSHAYLQQVHDGIPIHGAEITVSMNGDGHVQTLHSSFVTNANAISVNAGIVEQRVDVRAAVMAAEKHADVSETWMDGRTEQVWFAHEDGSLEPAWRTMVHALEPEVQDLLTVVSAVDGRVISQEDRSAHATGMGDVFDPNPYQTQGSGAGMVDNNDTTSATLDAQMVSVTLERLDDGTGLLNGAWVNLTSLTGGLSVPNANESSRVYEYDRGDDRFEQVVVYHAVDQIQEYFHSLGFDDDTGSPNGIRDFPTLANAHWYTFDQSFYSTGDDAIHFGDGGVDDGEDADIIAHEYGHAVQHDQNPNWGGGEMGAMGEGFGDYLAASFYADFGDATFQSSHAAAVGEWDAVSYSSANPPNLRRVDGNKTYPADLVGQVHADGEIWSAALWDIRNQLGGPTIDQLVLESHFGLPGGASMVDAANAILTADANLNSGANQEAIEQWFVARGILTAPDDHGNIASDATVVGVPSTTSGGIDYPNDLDFFQFPAVAGTTYQMEVLLGTSSDSTLTLYGTNGVTILGFDDDGGTGGGSLIGWTAPTSGNYYAVVSGTSIGSYNIDISTIATPADDHGDLTSAATPVSVPSTTAGVIEVASDSDVFAFDAVAGDTYRIEVQLGTLADSSLLIIDTNGTTQLASDTDGGAAAILWSASTNGTFYGVVTGGSQGSYDFDVSQLVDDHGNNAASATPIAIPSTTAGWLEFDGDHDFFEFSAVAGEGYQFDVILGSLTDSTMSLYDTDGVTELAFDDDGGPGFASKIRWVAPASGTYFVEVKGYIDERNGTYDLTAATYVPGFDDHGSNAATATPVALNSTTRGDLEENGDADYFSFTVPAGADVTLETVLLTNPDTTLTLYDTNGTNQLEFDDDGGAGLASRIDWTAPATGTYFVAVRGFSDARTGTYDLVVLSDMVLVSGDFDADGDYDCADIDALVAEIVSGGNAAIFDLTGDGAVDLADRDAWLAEAGAANLGPGRSYLLGDADLSGEVDVSDFIVWNSNKFTNVAAWCQADFTADGAVDVSDFSEWNANKFTSSDVALVVDQPDSELGVTTESRTTRFAGSPEVIVTSPTADVVADTPLATPLPHYAAYDQSDSRFEEQKTRHIDQALVELELEFGSQSW